VPIDPANPPWQNVTNAAASGTAERLALEYVAQTDGFMYIYVYPPVEGLPVRSAAQAGCQRNNERLRRIFSCHATGVG